MRLEFIAMTLAVVAVILALLAMEGCSGLSERITGTKELEPAPMSRDAERQNIIERGKDFCVRYPDDQVCKRQEPRR